jgi:hypothetical protein
MVLVSASKVGCGGTKIRRTRKKIRIRNLQILHAVFTVERDIFNIIYYVARCRLRVVTSPFCVIRRQDSTLASYA